MSTVKGKVNISYREFVIILKRNGFTKDRVNGSHVIWKKDNKHLSINIKPNAMVMLRLIKENNLQL